MKVVKKHSTQTNHALVQNDTSVIPAIIKRELIKKRAKLKLELQLSNSLARMLEAGGDCV
jgi:hypothetical protein